MKRPRTKISNPSSVAPPLKPYYSNAVRVSSGPLLFIAGQVALDKAGNVVGKDDLRAQAVQVLENIRAILVANKASMKDVVQVTVYVTDMRAFHDIADIRTKYFPKNGPSSVIVEVSKLALPDLQIEISAIAAV
ncbi:MAG: RidA family protein [Xanthobacteraceae bacterium]|jgi:2-iminobutanoate/2-iminopropanoate deaminase